MERWTPQQTDLTWPTIPSPPPGYSFNNQLRRPRECDVRRFFVLKDSPHKIAREALQINTHQLQRFKPALQRLTDEFGVATPGLDFQYDDHYDIYFITDRIYGLPIHKIGLSIAPELRDALALHFERMTTYYETIYTQGGVFLTDIGNLVNPTNNQAQYVFGHRIDETADQLYLVDIEARFETFCHASKEDDAGIELLRSLVYVTLDTLELADLTDYEPTYPLLERQQDIIQTMIQDGIPVPSWVQSFIKEAIQRVLRSRLLPIPESPYL